MQEKYAEKRENYGRNRKIIMFFLPGDDMCMGVPGRLRHPTGDGDGFAVYEPTGRNDKGVPSRILLGHRLSLRTLWHFRTVQGDCTVLPVRASVAVSVCGLRGTSAKCRETAFGSLTRGSRGRTVAPFTTALFESSF